MKKLLIVALAAILILATFTGCAKATYISGETFTKVLKDNGFTVVNGKESWYSGSDRVKEAFIAASPDDWQIEYYRLDSKDAASSVFSQNTGEDKTSGNGTYSKTRSGDSAVFKRTGSDTYCVVVQAGTMVIYCEAPKEYKEDVDQIFVDLGVFS